MENGNAKTVFTAFVLPVAAALILVICNRPLTVDWSVAVAQEGPATVDAGGSVTTSTIPLALVKSGIVGRVFIDQGALVRSGDTLAILDNREEHNMVARRRVEVEIARVNIEKTKNIEYRQAEERLNQAVILEALAAKQQARSDSLFLQGSITRSDLDISAKEHDIRKSQRVIAETDLAAILSIELQLCESRLKQAQLLLQEAEIALSRTILRAPSDGKSVHILHVEGEFVASGAALMLFQPADKVLSIELAVKPEKAHHIHPGQQAYVTISGDPSRSFETIVKGVSAGSAGEKGTVVVLLKPPAGEAEIRPGQAVSARIITRTLPGELIIAGRFREALPEGDCVYLKKGNRAKRCPVQLSDLGNGFFAVCSGISQGDTVIAAKGLSDHSLVRLGKRVGGEMLNSH